MTPIEAMARALCDDTLSRWRTPLGVRADAWEEFVPAARAVLDALANNVSEGMAERGGEIADDGGYYVIGARKACDIFAAMLRQARDEG